MVGTLNVISGRVFCMRILATFGPKSGPKPLSPKHLGVLGSFSRHCARTARRINELARPGFCKKGFLNFGVFSRTTAAFWCNGFFAHFARPRAWRGSKAASHPAFPVFLTWTSCRSKSTYIAYHNAKSQSSGKFLRSSSPPAVTRLRPFPILGRSPTRPQRA